MPLSTKRCRARMAPAISPCKVFAGGIITTPGAM